MLIIDGSAGEGGGQVLRSALALSLVTGTPVRIQNIRKARAKPGLLRQHLTAVNAIAAISQSEIDGAELGARELTVRPGRVRGGEYRFAVGSAGSACLVLQTVLPPLLLAAEPSSLMLEGGTHNPSAPSWDYLARVFFPLLERMGAVLSTSLDRYGFYPAGGGAFRVEIAGGARLTPLSLVMRGEARFRRVRALIAKLAREIGERELRALQSELSGCEDAQVVAVEKSLGPGNALFVELGYEHVTEMFTGFGERGVRAETVAHNVAEEVRSYLASDAPVGPHLADQLILPLALAGGGELRCQSLTPHTATNIAVVERFLPVRFRTELESNGAARIGLSARE
jgi:RNA 3'-terminal phosphate cyclase (ATP)